MTTFEAEIDKLPNHLSFYRWLVLRTELSDLPQKDKAPVGDSETNIVEFTPEATAAIVRFVEWAISVFNVTHPHSTFTPLRIHETLEAINEIWETDLKEISRTRLLSR